MTNLYDALISDSWNRASPKIQAYAYAIKQAVQLVIDMAKKTLCMADVDSLPEEVLDQLAVDSRVTYYSNDFDIEKKRALIKKSLIWYGQAGTVSTTKELLEIIFEGSASLIENPDGVPYTFDIETDGRLTEAIFRDLDKLLDDVKNVRSHLRQINRFSDAEQRTYFAAVTSEIIDRATTEGAVIPALWPVTLTDENDLPLLDENGAFLLDGRDAPL
jgi:P2-related tail formation protein